MATRTFDARQGLSAEALHDLRQPKRVALALSKDEHTAVLGYWVEAQNPTGAGADEFRAVLLPAQVNGPTDQEMRKDRPVVIDLSRGSAAWRKAIEPLQPGDIVSVEWDWQAGSERPGLVVDRSQPAVEFRSVQLYPMWEVRLRRGPSSLLTILLNRPAA